MIRTKQGTESRIMVLVQ